MARNARPFAMSVRSGRSLSAATDSTSPSSAATILLLRPSRMARQGRAAEFGAARSRGTGGYP